ncbi:uncharacterized protein C8Q71DRAFT_540000 [Rhodofomes roseus]|uniref:F-box domain-containing protein n=1 Tax=Rhodofomes roseus TaxID=34475 RepID=A0ABQ8KKK1_9APHY|nr:uncharacterized protein C8Q71DRAFT_540000 [Rhodofomes roseus]KAH9838640.1 hypothetical protein C8Q71DRAFT_540000 [Rhodofomes roseus]
MTRELEHKTEKTQASSDGASPAPAQPRQFPPELWSLIFVSVVDRATLLSASLACRVAHREVDPYLYREIVFKCWRNRYICAVHDTLEAAPRRANMVQVLAIQSATGHIESTAVSALVDIFRMVPNLEGLSLTLFDETNVNTLYPVLEQLKTPCPFRLNSLSTNIPLPQAALSIYAQQPEIISLRWNGSGPLDPASRIPSTALPRLKCLSCLAGYRPFNKSARGITHLEVGIPSLLPSILSSPEINLILSLLADTLVSLKVLERRRGYARIMPAISHRIPKCLRHLEVHERARPQSTAPLDPLLMSSQTYFTHLFLEPGLTLETFVWGALWMRSSESNLEASYQEGIQTLAEDLAIPCRTLRRFILCEKNKSVTYTLRNGKVADRVELPGFSNDTWARV